jgi:4-cresol dehydrogenase (hydroxylating)
MERILPPQVNGEAFRGFVAEAQKAVGRDYVYLDLEWELPAYNDEYATLPKALHQPSAAVAPANVAQVQAVVRAAGRYGIPLWPISMGKNFAYGGPAPRLAGAVVLDLKRMNRILEVNEKHAYAVVEPGVSYMDMYRHLQSIGSKLWIDPAAPGWGGMLGNLVDHGAGYTPYGDHLLMQCGMEVVLADGTIAHTAMGALPGSRTTHLYKYGLGPWADGLFTQSNFGVVTRIGIWLMPEPPGYTPFMITYEREEDLYEVTERVRPLKLNNIIPNAATTVEMLWEAAVQKQRRHYHTGKGPLPESARKKLRADLQIGVWNFYGAVYGPAPIMENNLEIIRDSLTSIPGAKIYFDDDRKGDIGWEYRRQLMRGIPNMTEYNQMNWIPNGGHMDFSPISPVTGEDAMRQYSLIRDRVNRAGFDYIGEMLVGWRDMHHIFALVYDLQDEAEKRRANQLFGELIDAAAAEGYGEYRTHLDFMDKIAGTYNWNDAAQQRQRERLKDALDPSGILGPGKMGIWPQRLRKEGV